MSQKYLTSFSLPQSLSLLLRFRYFFCFSVPPKCLLIPFSFCTAHSPCPHAKLLYQWADSCQFWAAVRCGKGQCDMGSSTSLSSRFFFFFLSTLFDMQLTFHSCHHTAARCVVPLCSDLQCLPVCCDNMWNVCILLQLTVPHL